MIHWRNTALTAFAALSLCTAAPAVYADTSPSIAFPGTTAYTVKAGDSLWKIATAHGVSIADLVQENRLQNPNVILVGQKLWIPSAAEIKANHVIATGERYIGAPYVWGGVSPSGFDCSGFTEYVFLKNGIVLPRNSADQFKTGVPVAKSELRKGDLVFFNDTYRSGISHVGIYIGNGQFIHASSGKGSVTISSMSNPYYAQHYAGAKRDIH
jgi:peptidoglycan DL-endopeptidase LytE